VVGGGVLVLLRVATSGALGGGLGHGPAMLRLDSAASTLEQWLVQLAQRGSSASSVVVGARKG
jgi:hypothetical protein